MSTRATFLRPSDVTRLARAFADAKRVVGADDSDAAATRVAAEWLLDNHYLIERVLAQLRRDMPPGFQYRLPRLAAAGKPRVLALAESIYDGSVELGLEELESFLAAYQEVTPLTIAELWALPVVIRLTVLRRYRAVVTCFASGVESTPSADAGTASGRAIRALRLLAEIDYKDVFRRHSVIDQVLAEDPAEAYAGGDFDTRDSYLRAVEELAFGCGHSEPEVAAAVLARARRGPPDGRHDHVGHWLIGPGRRTLERELDVRRRPLGERVRDRPHVAFFGLLAFFWLLSISPVIVYLLAVEASLPLAVLALTLSWIPASVPVVGLVNALLARVVRPALLPKLDLSEGIPRRFRTLVAVPALLGDEDAIDQLVDQLEVHHLANPDPQLSFALLTDHVDTERPPGPEHESRLAYATRAVRALNSRHGDRFHLLHRRSIYSEGEGRWMGWERKRGKLAELNRYLRGDSDTTYTVHVGSSEDLEGVAFVLTLDADTELPPGTAVRLVGTLAHPLNRPRFDDDGGVIAGYTVIQSRVEISPRSARASLFARLFSGDTGIDIYTRAVSETYQDLFGEGIYVGKGIYDVDAFQRSLDGLVPDNSLVSHDLFEGIHGRVGLATDVVVYEDYPPNYLAYLGRTHRWIRGDWQILPWVFGNVPSHDGSLRRNRLSLLSRFKIADNLRRSVIAPAVLALLVGGWLVLPGHPAFWTVAALLSPGAASLWSFFQSGTFSRRSVGRWSLAVCFAPIEAHVVLDAIARALTRMLWTRRRMLQWTTSAEAARALGERGRHSYFRRLWEGPVVALGVAAALLVAAPAALPWAAPWLLLWLASPEIAWRISRLVPARYERLDADEVQKLRHVARRTWLFFETFVGPHDNWLPPDHFQEQPRGEAAHRTSPTNIGLLLLSELAAYDLGYQGATELALRVSNTLDSLERLERHQGHILNWYDTRTLEPLEPRYVSFVDSGNLAGALITLAVGCEQIRRDAPLLGEVFAGLRDTAELLVETLAPWADASRDRSAREVSLSARALMTQIARDDLDRRERLDRASVALATVEARLLDALRAGATARSDPARLRDLRLWLDRLAHQLREAKRELELFAPLADDDDRISLEAIACADAGRGDSGPTGAHTQARALCRRFTTIADRARALADGMRSRFLYDEERRLFHVGYNVTAGRLDPHHYDLLASEARLGSYLAIVRGDAPLKHWFVLGRPLSQAGTRGRALLSWGGSMFEYLMPQLLMRSHSDTLLAHSSESAVGRQIEYGHERGVPWGISESGYAFLDGSRAYQYRSFGVPGLGIRRGLAEDLVVAPYASILALAVCPRAVIANFDELERQGMLGRFGFYEALDFHPQRALGERPAIVRSFMAHHHGMSLCAIDNYLRGDVMVERFHGDPRVKCGALLLDERVPLDVPTEVPLSETSASTDAARTPPPALPGWQPARHAMQVWVLGNGTLSSFITADGGGGLRFGELSVTRWMPDPVADHDGMWVYLVDEDTGEIFGASPAPVGGWPAEAHVHFDASRVAFHRGHGALAIVQRVMVASTEDVEIREVELANEGHEPRRVRVVGCMEPLLVPHHEAGRHPSFSRLFLRCQRLDDLAGVAVSRAPREGAPAPVVVFSMVGDAAARPQVIEIDREGFFGRRGDARTPAALTGTHRGASSTLDPWCACGAVLEIAPGSRRSVGFVTSVARTYADAVSLARRFATPRAVRWAFEDAGRAAARHVERLGTPPDLLPCIQRIASAVLVPTPSLRAPPSVLASAHPCQARLWTHGISGDEPLAVLRPRSSESHRAIEEMFAAHRYLRSVGLRFDLVLVDDAPSGYGEHRAESLRRSLAKTGAGAVLHQPGGVHLVHADQLREHELEDLCAAAQLYLDGVEGGLAAQLERPREVFGDLPSFEPAGVPPLVSPDPELALGELTLARDNGFGGFDGDDYVIKAGACPPAPWCNVLANERFGCLVSEAALGSTWALNAGENRLTPWHNDPVRDPPAEVVYLRDEETGRVWSPTPLPAGGPTRVRHGHGFSVFESVSGALTQTMTVFVPPDLPVKIVRLRIKNESLRPRRLTATYYAEWVLGARRAATRSHVVCEQPPGTACVLATTSWSTDFAGHVAFAAVDRSLHGFTTDRMEMLGRGGSLEQPAALRRWGLSDRVTPGLDPCAAIQAHLDLAPGETGEVAFMLGQCENREDALDLVRRLRDSGAIEEQWRACRGRWDALLAGVEVHTPDPALDRLCNRWLIYQSLSSRFFGRTALYQSSGAFGFRDQLQDALAFIHCDPSLTRRHILEAAAHQFVEGDVLHWWHPPGGSGVRTRCSDDLLWLVYVTADYVVATGDVAILDEHVPFLAGEPLTDETPLRYGRFASEGGASLFEHCRRALSRGFTTGPHGLPLMGDGDWNDGMNRVGSEGRGESVWLGWFVCACIDRFAELCDRRDEREDAETWRSRKLALAAALSTDAWDGSWYRRAFHDDGSLIGSAQSRPPHIDSIAQSWAALSGAGDDEQVALALAAAERNLVREHDRLVLLLSPPFDRERDDAGYIAAYPPGVRENGGQYTHAAAWLGWAHAIRGDGDAAYRILRLLNPLERTQTQLDARRYRVEPYVLAADVYGIAPWIGRGGWTWYTGAAAWTWRLAIEGVLGLRRVDGALVVEPCLPSTWPGFDAIVRAGDLTIQVLVTTDPGATARVVTLDGHDVDLAVVPLAGKGDRRLEIRLAGRRPKDENRNAGSPGRNLA